MNVRFRNPSSTVDSCISRNSNYLKFRPILIWSVDEPLRCRTDTNELVLYIVEIGQQTRLRRQFWDRVKGGIRCQLPLAGHRRSGCVDTSVDTSLIHAHGSALSNDDYRKFYAVASFRYRQIRNPAAWYFHSSLPVERLPNRAGERSGL
jgi:hypothetical protein